MRKQLLTATGKDIVLIGHFDDSHGASVHLACTCKFATTVNQNGYGGMTAEVTMNDSKRSTYRMAVVTYCPEFETYEHASSVNDEHCYQSDTLVCKVLTDVPREPTEIGSVTSFEELTELLAKY